ncbi:MULTISPECIES: cytochrome c [unclassified Bradyrhizobium]|jgi:mono/diheme cytochrome c family protein|uniref:c-type cytochrome n=1 Tax=unclassified Bradyrhizobium TaxID=2631580 RepID=UPI0007106544|nr:MULTISPECIES: cytochrome c [unclassified Bradyrhizobium]KQT17277.1 cytochrome C [Bradyrhizobium sp. Leaf396]
MSLAANAPKYLVLAVLAAGLGVAVWQSLGPAERAKGYIVNVNEPELSAIGRSGKVLFEANCAACHGLKAAGTDKGPPLVHEIYNPGHHSDAAFFFAAQRGVRQHHWPYGNMPPQPQVSEQQITSIVQYVRELQVANGIPYRPHRM